MMNRQFINKEIDASLQRSSHYIADSDRMKEALSAIESEVSLEFYARVLVEVNALCIVFLKTEENLRMALFDELAILDEKGE